MKPLYNLRKWLRPSYYRTRRDVLTLLAELAALEKPFIEIRKDADGMIEREAYASYGGYPERPGTHDPRKNGVVLFDKERLALLARDNGLEPLRKEARRVCYNLALHEKWLLNPRDTLRAVIRDALKDSTFSEVFYRELDEYREDSVFNTKLS